MERFPLPAWVMQDLIFFGKLVDQWKGIAIYPVLKRQIPRQCLSSDAAGGNGDLAICWFGVVVWWSIDDLFQGEATEAPTSDIVWRELMASLMLSVCIAAWLFDKPESERAAYVAGDNSVSNAWNQKSRSPKAWASAMLRTAGRYLMVTRVRLEYEYINTKSNYMADGGTRKHLRETEMAARSENFVTNELPPREPEYWPYKGRYPPRARCEKLVRGSQLGAMARRLCQNDGPECFDSMEEVAAVLRGIRGELELLHN
jgi:hypothetical protein